MSDCVSRKRPRGDNEEEEDLPPAKREPDQTRHKLDGTIDAPGDSRHDLQLEGRAEEKEDKEFWFEDGTVILIARDVKFRVYEGFLAGLSPVFKDMFAGRRALRNGRTEEVLALPCLVVPVSDSPEDLRHLLRVCFSRRLGGCVSVWDVL